jgi:hypothetical protein
MVDSPAPLWTSEEAAAATGGKALGTWAVNLVLSAVIAWLVWG